jgi:hypothetical protein
MLEHYKKLFLVSFMSNSSPVLLILLSCVSFKAVEEKIKILNIPICLGTIAEYLDLKIMYTKNARTEFDVYWQCTEFVIFLLSFGTMRIRIIQYAERNLCLLGKRRMKLNAHWEYMEWNWMHTESIWNDI